MAGKIGRKVRKNVRKIRESVILIGEQIKIKKEILPNFLTLFNAIIGFLAIIFAFEEKFYLSASLIFIAFIFDILDGLLARKLGVMNKVGMELDSLADAVSFVVAPAMLLYLKYFEGFTIGIITSVFIVIFGISRLAKFNVVGTMRYFRGMPTPYFAAIAATFILADISLSKWVIAPVFFVLGYMMINDFRYPNFKIKEMKRYKYLSLAAVTAFALVLVARLDILFIVIAEHAIIWMVVLLPMLFDKRFVSRRRLLIFDGVLLVLTIIFYRNIQALLILPIVYIAVASPFIEGALRVKG